MVFWILGAAILMSILGFTFLYKLAIKHQNSSTIDPRPKDVER